MNATVTDKYRARILDEPGLPAVLIAETALLPCGCHCHVCLRIDNREAATIAGECGPDHSDLIERFNALLLASLAAPRQGVPLVEVVAELLSEAA